MDYDTFLTLAKRIYNIAKNDQMFDVNKKELTKSDFPYGIFLAKRLNKTEFIGVKIMVGTKEKIKEVFENAL